MELGESSHRHPGKGPDPVTKAKRATVNSGLIVACVGVLEVGAGADARRYRASGALFKGT